MSDTISKTGGALASAVLHLRALADDPRPRGLGHAAKKIFLDAVGEPAASQAEACQPFKPYTASTLLESVRGELRPAVGVRSGRSYLLRYTTLKRDLSTALAWALTQGSLAPERTLVLDGIPLDILKVSLSHEGHDLAGGIDYPELCLPYLQQPGRGALQIDLHFITPTFFKRPGDLYMPLPYPELVFGSLAERWNAFAPLALPDGLREQVQQEVVIERFDLRSAAVLYKNGSIKIGAVGQAVYQAPRSEPQLLDMLNLLADFAFYSGVGQMASQGFGMLKRSTKGSSHGQPGEPTD